MAEIVVLGAGMMGTAFCVPLLDRGHRVRLVGTSLDVAIIEALRATGQHPRLPAPLPPGVTFHQLTELPALLGSAEFVVLGVSSAGIRWAGQQLAPLLRPGLPVLMITKGLSWEQGRWRLMPELFWEQQSAEVQATLQPVAVVGPCIAGELANRVETCVIFTGCDQAILESWAELARTEYYHIRCSTELVGHEVCAALKNGYAMAVGFGVGQHLRRGGTPGASVAWHNYEAALFAQCIREMARLVELIGGDPALAYGLSGVGDLMVTCQGGRTGRFGSWLGRGCGLAEAIERMDGATLECLELLRTLHEALPAFEQSSRLGVAELPLLRHLCEVVVDGRPVAVPFERF